MQIKPQDEPSCIFKIATRAECFHKFILISRTRCIGSKRIRALLESTPAFSSANSLPFLSPNLAVHSAAVTTQQEYWCTKAAHMPLIILFSFTAFFLFFIFIRTPVRLSSRAFLSNYPSKHSPATPSRHSSTCIFRLLSSYLIKLSYQTNFSSRQFQELLLKQRQRGRLHTSSRMLHSSLAEFTGSNIARVTLNHGTPRFSSRRFHR